MGSKRDWIRACRDSAPEVHRGVVVVVGALDVLFLMSRSFLSDGSVAQKLMHFCPPSITLFETFPETEGSRLAYNKFLSMDRIRHCSLVGIYLRRGLR